MITQYVLQVKSKVQRRWRHVFVDESQDMNACQWELIKQIVGPGSHLTIVGDPDQVGDL